MNESNEEKPEEEKNWQIGYQTPDENNIYWFSSRKHTEVEALRIINEKNLERSDLDIEIRFTSVR